MIRYQGVPSKEPHLGNLHSGTVQCLEFCSKKKNRDHILANWEISDDCNDMEEKDPDIIPTNKGNFSSKILHNCLNISMHYSHLYQRLWYSLLNSVWNKKNGKAVIILLKKLWYFLILTT